MIYDVKTVEEYLKNIPQDRVQIIQKLRETIKEHLPTGFSEEIQYGMIGYVVPLDRYPKGYHCKKDTPLPFVSIASQKNTINIYHMGIYVNETLLNWFTKQFSEVSNQRLDMGKSCIRFKNFDEIPFDLIGELMTKMSVDDVIKIYENA